MISRPAGGGSICHSVPRRILRYFLALLSQVAKETLRLYPPAPVTARTLTENTVINGLAKEDVSQLNVSPSAQCNFHTTTSSAHVPIPQSEGAGGNLCVYPDLGYPARYLALGSRCRQVCAREICRRDGLLWPLDSLFSWSPQLHRLGALDSAESFRLRWYCYWAKTSMAMLFNRTLHCWRSKWCWPCSASIFALKSLPTLSRSQNTKVGLKTSAEPF